MAEEQESYLTSPYTKMANMSGIITAIITKHGFTPEEIIIILSTALEMVKVDNAQKQVKAIQDKWMEEQLGHNLFKGSYDPKKVN